MSNREKEQKIGILYFWEQDWILEYSFVFRDWASKKIVFKWSARILILENYFFSLLVLHQVFFLVIL